MLTRYRLLSIIFTALHAMQTRYSDENSVRPSVRLSVCPSVTRVYCDKTVERSVQIYIPYERTFSLLVIDTNFAFYISPFPSYGRLLVKFALSTGDTSL